MIKAPLYSSVTVLVADESPFVRRIVRNMLLSVGMRHVVEASTGYEALERLGEIKPGLIIMQWELPEFSTVEILDILRDPSRVRETSVPVIVTTERPTRRVVDSAAERQVHHVLRKPFSPKMLWERIGHFFDDQNQPQMDERIAPKITRSQSMLLNPAPAPVDDGPQHDSWEAAAAAG
jgi:CheY-like chemotaxis protein